MEISNMKNIVVLKGLPSNIVEEAFVVIKPNMKIKQFNKLQKYSKNSKENKVEAKNSKDYILKEAEMLISNYISDIERPKEVNRKSDKLQKKYERLKRLTVILATLSVLSIIVNILT